MALANVTNQQVVDALRLIGYGDDVLGGLNLSGAQNSTFLTRLVNAGIPSEDFDRAKQVARQVGDEKFNGAGNQVSEIIAGLQRRGVSDDQIRQIVAQAQTNPLNQPSGSNTPSITQGQAGAQTFDVDSRFSPGSTAIGGGAGAPIKVNVAALLDSASKFNSAATESVRKVMTATPGVSTPAQPAQTPTSAPAQIPTEDKIGPHPGAAAVATTQAAKAAAPAPAAAPGAGGGAGGPNNKVTVDDPNNWDDEHIRTWLKSNLGGTDAWFLDIPEVWSAMKDAVKAGRGATGADAAFKSSAFYQTTSSKARLWYEHEREDPPTAAYEVGQQTTAVMNMAQQAGITIDPARAQSIAQSYLRYGWTQTDLQRSLGAEFHYDPSTKNQAAAVTQMKQTARNWLVPLSDQAIQTWGQGLISGSATQDQFNQYLRDSAKSLMPQLSNLIDQHAGDANFSVSTFVDPYRQHAADLLGIQPDQVDFNDPSGKWRQALDTVDSKTGERRIMSLSEWSSKVKSDATYGYDKSANGIQDGMQLAQSLKSSFGF